MRLPLAPSGLHRGRRTPRDRQRGAAALELALVVPMFAMLLLGMLDYGKYLYVSITATEAARQGARELSQIAVGNCSAGTPVTNAITLAQGSSGAAKLYMNQIGLSSSTTVTATCSTSPVNPTWQVSLQIDYTPTLKYLLNKGLMPAGATGKTRVRASLKMRGN